MARIFHCPLKSVPHTHKVKGTVGWFHKTLCLSLWSGQGQSNWDSLLILDFILIQQQLVSCRGLFNMLSSPSTGTSFVRMARHHTSGCSTRLIQVLWFISGKQFWLMFKPEPALAEVEVGVEVELSASMDCCLEMYQILQASTQCSSWGIDNIRSARSGWGLLLCTSASHEVTIDTSCTR